MFSLSIIRWFCLCFFFQLQNVNLILAERVHSQIKKKNDFWLLWIWLSCNLKILDNFATSVSTVSVLLKKVRSCRSVLFKLGEKINKKAAFYLSPSPFRWGPLSILTLTTMNAFNQKMSWKVRVKMSIELIWLCLQMGSSPRIQRHIRDFHSRPRAISAPYPGLSLETPALNLKAN